MGEITRPQLAVYVAAAIAIALLGARYLHGQDGERQGGGAAAPRAAGPPGVRVESAEGGLAVVNVAGAVRRPGVYRLPASARVDDAVRRAGGATRRADLTGVNLAAKVEDGRQILVPERVPKSNGTAPAAPAGPAPPPPPGQPLNLNTATLEQLDTLDGIGPSLAQAILDFREENGGFGSVDELAQVPGIGEKRMASLREQVTV